MGRVKEWYRELMEQRLGYPTSSDQAEFEMSILPMEHNRKPLTTKQINLMVQEAARLDKPDQENT
jgi:hypothetical protein